MGIQLTRIDDKADGFTVDFTVTNKYRQTFSSRPAGVDQMTYAREQVRTIVKGEVEKPEGVEIVPAAILPELPELTHDLTGTVGTVAGMSGAGTHKPEMSDALKRAMDKKGAKS